MAGLISGNSLDSEYQMGLFDRIRRDKAVREAEGYLEFGMPDQAISALAALGCCVATDGPASYLIGEALREQERYSDALAPLERAAQLISDDVHVYLSLAWCYKRTGQLPLAIGALERALDIEPLEAILHYNLACYWSLAGNRNVSLRYLAKAFDIDVDYRDLIHEEPDFDNLRDDPEFQELTSVAV